jgi:ubiquinone/menaquinone biosynthesis C-methylase UbiE
LNILNVGVGTGDDVPVLAHFGDVYAIDIDQKALDLVDASCVIEKRQGDACQLPYADGMFDVVVSFDVMEHVEHDQKMVDEIHRILKKNGTYIFTVPAYNWLYSAHDRVLGHYRRYNRKTVHKLFSAFEKVTLGNWVFFLFLPAVIKRLMSRKSTQSEVPMLPAWLNKICYMMLTFENWCIGKKVNFPFGLTLYGMYKKK